MSEREIDETFAASFPASDPPSWTLGLESDQLQHRPENSIKPAEENQSAGRTNATRKEEMMQSPTKNVPDAFENHSIDPGVRIGHIHLKVADLDRAIGFYRDVLGFEVTQRYGTQAAFLSAGGYHHHIGLNTWESLGGPRPPPGTTGLYHLAILYPTRAELADALYRVLRAGITLDGASDHGVSEALYLRDPDGNGVELYWDRPKQEWPRNGDGGLNMFTRHLDTGALLREANQL